MVQHHCRHDGPYLSPQLLALPSLQPTLPDRRAPRESRHRLRAGAVGETPTCGADQQSGVSRAGGLPAAMRGKQDL